MSEGLDRVREGIERALDTKSAVEGVEVAVYVVAQNGRRLRRVRSVKTAPNHTPVVVDEEDAVEYQRLAPTAPPAGDPLKFRELRAKNVERCERFYHPFEEWSLQDWLMAVTGELGELANVLKHARRGQNTGPIATDGVLDVVALGNEAADVVIYLDLLCARAGVDLGAAVRWKFNTVSRKRLGCDLVLPLSDEVSA